MSDWIEINLPWHISKSWDTPLFEEDAPDLDKEMEGLFGKSSQELYDKISNEEWDLFLDNEEKASQETRNKILKYRELAGKEREFEDNNPEMQAWEKRKEEFYNLQDKKFLEKFPSFCGKGLNKSGILIEVKIKNEVKEFLIGDINEAKGVCDDCVEFGNDTIVLRYKIIWNKQ
jgi:hypothetical protein